MKRILLALTALLLLTGCGSRWPFSGGNLPYRVWESWEEMQEVLGDYLLFPTYLPEVTQYSENVFKSSEFYRRPRGWGRGEVYIEYFVLYLSDRPHDTVSISAYGAGTAMRISDTLERGHPLDSPPSYVSSRIWFQESDRFDEHIVLIGGIDVRFELFFATSLPAADYHNLENWHKFNARNGRAIRFSFTIDAITYRMSWTQYNVEDKYAYREQYESATRVATSIIEQVREIE